MSASVAIVCREASHADAPVTVARFDQLVDPHDATSLRWIVADGYGQVASTLVGDQRWQEGAQAFIGDAVDGDAPTPRVRFRFRCQACGLSVERHGEDVYPKLDKLAAAGVVLVTLRALGATL